MEHVSTFFKEDNDIFYKVGEKRGSEKEKAIFVTNLLMQTDHPIAKIASLANMTEAFVKNIKETL